MADVVGDLVFDTTINSGQFDAGLAKLENNAKKAANNVDKAAQKVAALRQQLEELQAVAENEKKTRSTGTVSQETGDAIQKTTQQMKDAQLQLQGLQADQAKANDAIGAYMQKQQSAAASTSKVSEQMGKFAKRIATIEESVYLYVDREGAARHAVCAAEHHQRRQANVCVPCADQGQSTDGLRADL